MTASIPFKIRANPCIASIEGGYLKIQFLTETKTFQADVCCCRF